MCPAQTFSTKKTSFMCFAPSNPKYLQPPISQGAVAMTVCVPLQKVTVVCIHTNTAPSMVLAAGCDCSCPLTWPIHSEWTSRPCLSHHSDGSDGPYHPKAGGALRTSCEEYRRCLTNPLVSHALTDVLRPSTQDVPGRSPCVRSGRARNDGGPGPADVSSQ